MNALRQCRVVLVRPHYPGNIGSAARAMANFGFRDLVLVDPVANPAAHEARMLAANGVEILDALRVVPTLADAVADCGYVLATGGDADGTARETLRGGPDELLPAVWETLQTAPAAVVFGPEPHGLTTAEVGRCHALLHLPADGDYSSLNLALSVGIVLYELRRHASKSLAQATNPAAEPGRRPAPFADLNRAFDHLEASFRDVHFLYGQNADGLMRAFRHLVARSRPTPHEVRILHGLARQLDFLAGKMAPRKTETPPPPPG